MNKNLKNNLLGFISVVGLVSSIGFGVNYGQALSNVNKKLSRNSDYVEATKYQGLSSQLETAERELTGNHIAAASMGLDLGLILGYAHVHSMPHVSHPPRPDYPDPADAKKILSNVLDTLGDYNDLDDKLRQVKDSLPDQNEIKEYNGNKVTQSTFKNEREIIDSVKSSLIQISKNYMNKVPKELLDEQSACNRGIYFSVFSGIISVILGMYVLGNKNK
ncbi:hypothetical protein HZA97_06965 [Candidatus Woesearchaeota archaeon]|nr:hypothetical protein [Candidatus Woesearchaeota archaeon]